MAGKRKQHTNDFKARVALDAIRGIKTLSELSALHGVCERRRENVVFLAV